ncbi:protein kinase [Sorangium sp. So ce291]|uniref:nSTAND1 domain-containing NTPase n=1 Tax=Sorangium sp. So ce291 TaxID=3133294 RepID=UPI003F636AE7
MTQLATSPAQPPLDFEEYRLVRLLGRGAMGEVFLAHDTALDRPVAIKFVSRMDPDDRTRQRFFLEARALARVRHPNVVSIHRVGEVRRRPYLVSEYIAGCGLDVLDRPVPLRALLSIARGLAAGLAAAHRQGILHRDIKPANAVLTPEGTVKLIDFGLAELMGPDVTGSAEQARPTPVRGSDPSGGDSGDATLSADVTRSAERTVAAASIAPGQAPRTSPRLDPAALTPAAPLHGRRVAGTPLYMAPELWDGAPASPRSDVYALGALLYELCTGAAPHAGVPLAELPEVARTRDAPRLADVAPGVDAGFRRAVERCLERAPEARFASGDELCDALEALQEPERSPVGGCPYRGLLGFEAAHTAVFFGRSAETRALYDRLRSDPLVLVTGDSGAGKSSLCRAGVLPLVLRDGLGGGAAWTVVDLEPGSRPLAALASALAPRLGTTEEELGAAIRRDPAALGRRLRERSDGEATLVLIDQLEEVLTLADPEEAALAGAVLGGMAIRSPCVRVLATARSDFLTRLTSLPEVGRAIARSIFLVRAMDADDIRQAIVGPAAAAGIRFEREETVRELTAAAMSGPGGLPLLQFALAELWQRRDPVENLLTEAALDAMGGVMGALARHADGVLAALPLAERRAAQRILVGLVTADGTRARRSLDDLARPAGEAGGAAVRNALDALVRGRLLVARPSDEGQTAFEIAHEALLARWDTLRGWLSHDAELLALRQRIERAATDWHRLGEHPAALWSRVQLAELRALEGEDASLGQRERRFLAASRRAARRRRWAAIPAACIALLAAAGIYSGVRAFRDQAELDRAIDARLAAAARAEETARRLDAEAAAGRVSALATYRSAGRERGEQAWARAHALALQADEAYNEAAREIDSALALQERPALRARAADILLARLVSAESDGRTADREALGYRLASVDLDGSRRTALQAGGSVAITASAPASAKLVRFERRDRELVPLAPRDLGTTPVAEIPLDQGSYLVELSAPGRATVRAPFVVGRGERVALKLDPPLTERVPEGFVYVPAGAFLSGSSEAGARRTDVYHAMPPHRAETAAFLIARHEVTFGDWIRYLEALPPDERALRTPRGRDERDDMQLSPIGPGKWRLTFDDGRVRYSAASSETFVGRNGRKGVWERFPVVAISQGDAMAYAAWLDATGRVPGARLCREDEWERAGRGADGRRYPTGDRLDYHMANISPVDGHDPDGFDPREVGSYPASRTVFGLDDMSGNAAEFALSIVDPGKMAQRSGSWFQGIVHARLDKRDEIEQSIRHPRVGFRLCATPR